ncbi:DUF692 domain-containing protein [Roseateles sp. DB2]|uniref:DUF692 domain-containing protein n=1 Tax=Roseateles sp. DB2 TaxID=3453717 RepID=UPI003EEB1284
MQAAEDTVAALCGIGWRHGHEAELLERRPPLPFIEVHSENYFQPGGAALQTLSLAREHYPVSLHGVGLSLGSASGLDPWHLAQLARLAERIQPLRISDHASFARVPLKGQMVHGADLLPVSFTRASLNLMVSHVQQVQDRLGQPLLIENLSAYLDWSPEAGEGPMAEVDFLDELCRRSGCGLLLDLNNLMVNALNRRGGAEALALQDVAAWVASLRTLPGEIHLAGHSRQQGLVVDDHGDHVSEPLWRLYQHTLQRFGRRIPTLIEWDTRLPTLDLLLAEARRADAVAAQAFEGEGRMLNECHGNRS